MIHEEQAAQNKKDECRMEIAPLVECLKEMQPDSYREAYLEYRKTLDQIDSEQQASFDNKLLALAGTFLAFSTTFIDKIVPLSLADYLSLLFISWGAFLISTLAVLASFKYSAKSASAKLKKLDDRYSNPSNVLSIYDPIKTKYDEAIEALNWSGSYFFILGILFLIAFICLNTNNIGKKASTSHHYSQTKYNKLEKYYD